MSVNNFYPPITNLVGADNVPEKLGLLKDGIDALLGKLYYN